MNIAEEYASRIMNGDRLALTKAITLAESTLETHEHEANQIVDKCLPYSGKSIRIGITGVPGVGKSTFINAFGKHLLSIGKKVAVLAIDPSSSRSHGSILGDKTRMNELVGEPTAFIRPSPSSGNLGGVSKATRQSIILCEAAGFDVILVETVGVGQSETEVHSMVDFFILLMLTGAGDELQGIKRGIMEMADMVLINKADGDNLPKARSARTDYNNALHLFPPADSGWIPPAEICSSLNSDDMNKVWDLVSSYQNLTISNGFFEKNRQNQTRLLFREIINKKLQLLFFSDKRIENHLHNWEEKIQKKEVSPFTATEILIKIFKEEIL